MASTYSTNLRLELQATGENATTWGTKANNVFDMIEDALTAVATIAMADTNKTLTTANGSADQARSMFINATGANTAIRSITIPTLSKLYIVKNATTGGFAITVTNGSSSVNVPNGAWTIIWTDGTTVYGTSSLSAEYALKTEVANLSGVTDASAARTNLGLGTMATQAASAVAITGGAIAGITDLAIADGGTGASSASAARTNLGLGTIATQNATNIAVTGGSMSGVTITGGSMSGMTDIAVADGGTGSSTAAGARTNLGIGTLGTQNSNAVSITGGSISGLSGLAVDNYVTANRYYFNSTTSYIMNGGAGTVWIYPSGAGSATGRCYFNTNTFGCVNISASGAIEASGSITATGHVVTPVVRAETTMVVGAGNNTIYLRPQGYNDAGGQATLTTAGTFTAAGNVTAFSDERLKFNLETIPDALDKVSALRGLTFQRSDMDDTEKRHTGLIAQDVQKVLPEAVIEGEDGTLSLAYGNLVGLLVEAIKELRAEVQILKEAK